MSLDTDWLYERSEFFSKLVRSLDYSWSVASYGEVPNSDLELRGSKSVGAWALLAIFEELDESWSVFDHSDDQIVRLNLGLLQRFEPVFLARRLLRENCGASMEFQTLGKSVSAEVEDESGQESSNLLLSWMRGEFDFVHAKG